MKDDRMFARIQRFPADNQQTGCTWFTVPALKVRRERFACNHGRACGTLRSNGRDVGAILIAEGLAVPFVCGATSCPKTPRPWCQ
jgi:hypothetical protein